MHRVEQQDSSHEIMKMTRWNTLHHVSTFAFILCLLFVKRERDAAVALEVVVEGDLARHALRRHPGKSSLKT